jgi:hypothetical protein
MTALMVIKYGNFNQSLLLTNLVYDTALAMRTAQNYGLSVKTMKDVQGNQITCSTGVGNEDFQCAYGVAFDSSAGKNDHFSLFADTDSNGQYGSSDKLISTYTLKRGATISGVCAGDGCSAASGQQLSVTFMRPDPNANICFTTSVSTVYQQAYAKITIKGTDNTTRSISVRSNGQISVDI